MLKYFAYDYIPNPYTIFKGISKLEPGFYASLFGNHIEKRQYWNIEFNESLYRRKTIAEYEKTFRELHMLKENDR